MKTDRIGCKKPGKPGEHLKNIIMEINNNNTININNLDLKERSEPWARRCLDGLCGHVGDVLCAKRIAEDGWHESVEEDRLLTPEEYNELAPSIAEEFVNRWVKNRGNRVLERMMAEMLRAEAKYLVKAWDEWQKRGANAGPTCDKCGEDRNAIGGRVCWTCDLNMPQFEYKNVGHYHTLPICHCKVEEEEEEEDRLEQLAQVTFNGNYCYEVFYNRDTEEVQVEINTDRNGEPLYYYYPATMTIARTIEKVVGQDQSDLSFNDLRINCKEVSDTDAEVNEFYRNTWSFHIGMGRILQFNVDHPPYDDGNAPPRRTHDDGFDEYEYDEEEERRQEMAENAERQVEAEKEKFD